MSSSFRKLASYYDTIYADKNYSKEVDFIEECFRKYDKPKYLLEIGCGTGNYTKIFSERGYKITGIDLSADMLEVARSKCDCNFINSDVRTLDLERKFDCCLALFAVIGYVTDNSELANVFRRTRIHLKRGGLFIFDVWNGLALMRTLPECRVKEAENNELRIVRFARPTLKAFKHICEVDYKLFVTTKGEQVYNEINEKHIVRFYFPQELKYFLEIAGFEVLKICPFLDLNGNVDERVWNMTIIARTM
jgi:SAM-dependent methyltransferase